MFVIWDNGTIIICCLFCLNICSSFAAVYCMSILRVGQSSVQPPREKYRGVWGISEHSLSHGWVLIRKCFYSHLTRQSDYRALLLSLSHRNSSMVGAAPSVRKAELGALLAPDQKTDPSHSAFIMALCGINL